MPTLLVFAGQSNAVGYPHDAADVPADLRLADPAVRIWTGAGWATLRPGANSGTPVHPGYWGPETEFAREWRRAHPGDVLYIVKVAKGETALAPGPGLDWAPGDGELFGQTTAAVRAARASLARQGVAVRTGAIFWMQGEQDSTTAAWAKAYEGRLAAFFRAARTDWGEPVTPIVYGRIVVSTPYPFAGAVRAAQARVQAQVPRAVMVDTDAFPTVDRLHFSVEGQRRLGAAFYQAYAAGLKRRAQTKTAAPEGGR